MEEIKAILAERERYLLNLKKEKEESLKDVLEGHLRISQNGDKVQYYKRTDPKDFSGKYLSTEEIQVASKLAQKDYDKKVLRAAEQELKAIQKYISTYPAKNSEQIYESLHKARQKLITPIREADEQYVIKWENVRYQRKEFYESTPVYYTTRGERVRSKSEVIIADALSREGIPYRLEYPVHIKGVGNFYPDFMVLNVRKRKELIWEHFGMMDDSEYAEMFVKKMLCYEENGYYQGENLICTFETKVNPINQRIIKNIIERYLK